MLVKLFMLEVVGIIMSPQEWTPRPRPPELRLITTSRGPPDDEISLPIAVTYTEQGRET